MSVWFKSRLNPWYIWIPSNPNLYSTKIIMKMRWQTIASNVSIRTISPTATPLPKAYDCVAVYIAGRRTSLVVYGWWPQPPTKKGDTHVLPWHYLLLFCEDVKWFRLLITFWLVHLNQLTQFNCFIYFFFFFFFQIYLYRVNHSHVYTVLPWCPVTK